MLSAEQKKMRMQGIGGSEIAAVLGLNPYAGPMDVYLAKTEGREIPVTHHMERGIFYEDATAKWYAHRTGAKLREVGTVFHPYRKYVFCTPDRLATRPGQEEIDLSIKVPGPYAEEQWGEPGTDEVPDHYMLQLHLELAILGPLYGILRGEIAAPIAGDLAVYFTLPDGGMQENLLDAAERFFVDHVIPRKPPPPDGSETYGDFIRQRLPSARGAVRQADARAEQLAAAYRLVCDQIKGAEKEKARLRQELELIIGDASGLVGSFGKLSLTKVAGSAKIDWEGLAANLNIPDEIKQRFTRVTDGHWRLNPSWKKAENE